MNFHFMFEPDVTSDIRLKLLHQLFVLSWGTTNQVIDVINIFNLGPGGFLGLHHGLNGVLHGLLNEVVGGSGHGGSGVFAALGVALEHVAVVEFLLQVLDF